jgi:intergrase/recombinase
LNRALRVLFNFYEIEGIPEGYLNALRKAIPQDNIGVDLRIPTEQEIIDSLRRLRMAPLKYQALFNLLLDSGLRIVEAERLIKEGLKNPIKVGAYYRCTLGYFRGCKLAYVAYFSEDTLALIRNVEGSIEERNASGYFSKFGFLPPKYLRKYAFDKMISLNIPESVADFIEGRVPKKIGAKHYMALIRQADRFYGRYAKYLNRLRTLI